VLDLPPDVQQCLGEFRWFVEELANAVLGRCGYVHDPVRTAAGIEIVHALRCAALSIDKSEHDYRNPIEREGRHHGAMADESRGDNTT
jgi:hypothetical protein